LGAKPTERRREIAGIVGGTNGGRARVGQRVSSSEYKRLLANRKPLKG
jgi:hypothetical protein